MTRKNREPLLLGEREDQIDISSWPKGERETILACVAEREIEQTEPERFTAIQAEAYLCLKTVYDDLKKDKKTALEALARLENKLRTLIQNNNLGLAFQIKCDFLLIVSKTNFSQLPFEVLSKAIDYYLEFKLACPDRYSEREKRLLPKRFFRAAEASWAFFTHLESTCRKEKVFIVYLIYLLIVSDPLIPSNDICESLLQAIHENTKLESDPVAQYCLALLYIFFEDDVLASTSEEVEMLVKERVKVLLTTAIEKGAPVDIETLLKRVKTLELDHVQPTLESIKKDQLPCTVIQAKENDEQGKMPIPDPELLPVIRLASLWNSIDKQEKGLRYFILVMGAYFVKNPLLDSHSNTALLDFGDFKSLPTELLIYILQFTLGVKLSITTDTTLRSLTKFSFFKIVQNVAEKKDILLKEYITNEKQSAEAKQPLYLKDSMGDLLKYEDTIKALDTFITDLKGSSSFLLLGRNKLKRASSSLSEDFPTTTKKQKL